MTRHIGISPWSASGPGGFVVPRSQGVGRWQTSEDNQIHSQVTTGKLSAVSCMSSLGGEDEPQNDLAVIDLSGGLEPELLVEGPRLAVAGIVAGQ